MTDSIDVVILSKDETPLRQDVAAAIAAQRGVQVRVHRVIGHPQPSDVNRWQTIARARNAGKQVGDSPWLMFLDDDVVLAPDCVVQLVRGLQSRRGYGALAADFLGESVAGATRGHVAMGAALFRRCALDRIRFRWQAGRCECQCCCDDLRAAGFGIAYHPTALARHATPVPRRGLYRTQSSRSDTENAPLPGRVLVAFDRRHFDRFCNSFLRSLRSAGNWEWTTVLGYGLYPSQQQRLMQMPNVELVSLPINGVMAPVRRLREFPHVLERWPTETPVAYWDAGDVMFQDNLEPLWKIVRAHPKRLLAAREPKSYPYNRAVAAWTLSIRSPIARQRAFELLSRNPFLNSGFAAGTAATMIRYFRAASRMLQGEELAGTSDWGDQTALNYYCYANPGQWLEVPDGWNYCLHDRRPGEVRVRPDGQFVNRQGTPIHVIHGNARSLRKRAIIREAV